MPAAMEVTREPDFGPRAVQERGSLLVLALLAFAVGGTSGLLGAVFRLVLERSDRFRGAVIDWAHGKEITGFVLVIGISAIATGLAAWLVRKFAPGAKGSGISDVEAVLRDEQPPPPLILIPVKFVGGVLAMGAGLALGRDGPTAQMGAAIGHFLGTAFRRRAVCLRPCWSLELKAVLSWEHSFVAGSLTSPNAQQPLPLSAWPRSSPLSCVLR